MKEKKYLL
jgi:hypothetical protein